jgi:hypothetical protein
MFRDSAVTGFPGDGMSARENLDVSVFVDLVFSRRILVPVPEHIATHRAVPRNPGRRSERDFSTSRTDVAINEPANGIWFTATVKLPRGLRILSDDLFFGHFSLKIS